MFNFKKESKLRKTKMRALFVCIRFKMSFLHILKRKGANLRKGFYKVCLIKYLFLMTCNVKEPFNKLKGL